MQQVRIIISGRVQRVGFRWSAKNEADQLGVTGYVRNMPDGKVEIIAQGPQAAVEALIAWSRRGPSFARVSNMDVTKLAAQGRYTEFTLRR